MQNLKSGSGFCIEIGRLKIFIAECYPQIIKICQKNMQGLKEGKIGVALGVTMMFGILNILINE